jgi:hypothetical protein
MEEWRRSFLLVASLPCLSNFERSVVQPVIGHLELQYVVPPLPRHCRQLSVLGNVVLRIACILCGCLIVVDSAVQNAVEACVVVVCFVIVVW